MIIGFTDQLERAHKKLFLKAGILFWDLKDVGTLRIINLRVSDGRGAAENIWRFQGLSFQKYKRFLS